MTNCEQFPTKCCVKIAATLTLASTDVFLIKMCQCSRVISDISEDYIDFWLQGGAAVDCPCLHGL